MTSTLLVSTSIVVSDASLRGQRLGGPAAGAGGIENLIVREQGETVGLLADLKRIVGFRCLADQHVGQGYGWVEIAGLSFHRLQVVDDGVADVALETVHVFVAVVAASSQFVDVAVVQTDVQVVGINDAEVAAVDETVFCTESLQFCAP